MGRGHSSLPGRWGSIRIWTEGRAGENEALLLPLRVKERERDFAFCKTIAQSGYSIAFPRRNVLHDHAALEVLLKGWDL